MHTSARTHHHYAAGSAFGRDRIDEEMQRAVTADLRNQPQITLAVRYRLEQELGKGGMATVYLADDVRHHRRVAIKVLHPELGAALGGERFLRETEVTANLRDPQILPLHDSGEAEGLLYYVMPYVEGESLRERLKRIKRLRAAGRSVQRGDAARGQAAVLDLAREQVPSLLSPRWSSSLQQERHGLVRRTVRLPAKVPAKGTGQRTRKAAEYLARGEPVPKSYQSRGGSSAARA